MNAKERRKVLMNELQSKKRVYIADIAARLDVSSMTVRRDLARLTEGGIVTMIHGGAVFNEGGFIDTTGDLREKSMLREKNIIAKICADLIGEGSSVFLDNGSTGTSIAGELAKKKNIAVITNSLPAMNVLSGNRNIQLISLPGIYVPRWKGFFGAMTERYVGKFRLDAAFMSADSLTADLGLMSCDHDDKHLKLAVMDAARKKILVADHTKIGKENFLKICDLQEMDLIVTDRRPDDDFLTKMERRKVEVRFPAPETVHQ